MLNITIDVTALGRERLTGVGNYVKNLILNLAQSKDLELECLWKLSRLKNRKPISGHIGLAHRPYFPVYDDLRMRSRVFHGPDFKLLASHAAKRVVTVHDLFVFDGRFQNSDFAEKGRENFSRMMAQRPDHVVTVSQFTKDEILRYFPQYRGKISVTHLGADHLLRELATQDALSSEFKNFVFDLAKPFFLFFGSVELRKNPLGVLRAFERFSQKYGEVQLLIVGQKGWGSEEVGAQILSLRCRDRVHWMEFVSYSDLALLMKRCLGCVYPSFYEGFGLPVLEAQHLGAPVLTSRGGALEEVAGASALLVDPADVDEIENGLTKLYESNELRDDLRRRGLENLRRFSWAQCAEKTISVYKD